MKYGKYFDRELSKCGPGARVHSIHYDRLKVLLKTQPDMVCKKWRKILHTECKKVVAPTLHLQVLNTDAFYKICKKMDKKFDLGALEMYHDCVKRHTYAFTDVTRLKII